MFKTIQVFLCFCEIVNLLSSHGLGLPNDEVIEISVTMRVIGDVADIVERLPQVAAKVVKPDSTLYIVSQTGAVRCDANLDEKFSVILKVMVLEYFQL